MPKYVESEMLELKEKYTDVICKEIVSFLNTSGGTIVIGVKDDGTVVGVDKIDETFKKISVFLIQQLDQERILIYLIMIVSMRQF
jgi:predicted HTH transcriptional regulator